MAFFGKEKFQVELEYEGHKTSIGLKDALVVIVTWGGSARFWYPQIISQYIDLYNVDALVSIVGMWNNETITETVRNYGFSKRKKEKKKIKVSLDSIKEEMRIKIEKNIIISNGDKEKKFVVHAFLSQDIIGLKLRKFLYNIMKKQSELFKKQFTKLQPEEADGIIKMLIKEIKSKKVGKMQEQARKRLRIRGVQFIIIKEDFKEIYQKIKIDKKLKPILNLLKDHKKIEEILNNITSNIYKAIELLEPEKKQWIKDLFNDQKKGRLSRVLSALISKEQNFNMFCEEMNDKNIRKFSNALAKWVPSKKI